LSLRVAVQMDPLESINIGGDSSFALMLSAQTRGHQLWHYDVRTLAWENGRLTAWARPVRVQRVPGDHHAFEGICQRSTLRKRWT
jgi:glutathione synthase